MTLSENSWLVRFAFLGSDFGIPAQTSLCAMFWRIVFRTLIALGLLGLLGGYLYAWGFHTWITFLRTFWVLLAILTLIGVANLEAYFKNRAYRRREMEPAEHSAFVETIYAIKNRVCPIIRIEGRE